MDQRQPAEGLRLVEQVVDGALDKAGQASPTRGAVHVVMVRASASLPVPSYDRAQTEDEEVTQWVFGPTC